MKAALYIRVSTDEQVRDGVSIEEQKERLHAYAMSQGWKDFCYYIDEGVSAKDFDRPSFLQMKTDIENQKIQAVVTTKIDRLTRRLMDLLQFVDFIDEYQCIYKSATESFDTSSAAGKMVLQLLGVFAEFERERIGERVRDNMLHLAKQGKPISRPCFGYDLVNKNLMINKEEAKWVQQMAQWFLTGYGTFQIARKLNENEIRTKNGGHWSAKAVRDFLTDNQMLIGHLVWNKNRKKGKKIIQNPPNEWLIYSNSHPPILDTETYHLIQNKIQRTKKLPNRKSRTPYLLSGLLRCGHCEAKMIGSRTKEVGRYICSNYHKKGRCFNHWIHSEIIESYILKQLFSLVSSDPVRHPLLEKLPKQKWMQELRAAKKAQQAWNEKAQRQLEAFESGVLSLAEFKQARERLLKQKEDWEEKEKQLLLHLTETNDEQFEQLLIEKGQQLKHLSSSLITWQQKIVRELIYDIHIYEGNEIEVCYLL